MLVARPITVSYTHLLIGVLFTFDTLVFNFVIAAITLIAIHEVFKACLLYTSFSTNIVP